MPRLTELSEVGQWTTPGCEQTMTFSFDGTGAVFSPEDTAAMLQALDGAWHSLKESGHVLAADFRAASTRDALARAILQSAQDGETDPARLKTQAVAALLANAPKM
jgi:hypothetical protein